MAILEAAIGGHPAPPFWYYFSYGHTLFTLKRYGKTEAALDSCVDQLPTAPYCLRLQISNYAQLGKIEDAQWVAEEYKILGFDLTIPSIMSAEISVSPQELSHYREGLIKAGIPES